MRLFKSASRIVFILIAIGAIAGLFTGHIKEDNFMILAVSAFSYYFTKTPPANSDTTGSDSSEEH